MASGRSHRERVAHLLAVAIAGSLAGVPAVARTATLDGASSAATIGEVVVTARHREENVQSVPAAVSVLSGEALDSAYTVNTQQLAQLVPALYYNSANPRNTAYTIRGLGSNTLSVSAANDGIEPGVGFYVDQVYHARPATAAFDFTDIERVEVLRGPQGTLFGKNTTGGAIHLLSREPTFTPEAGGDVSVGEYDYVQARASFSGPLTDEFAGRVSAQLTRRDGVVDNVATGDELNALDNYALRGQLLFRPNDSLKVRLIADVTDLDSDCCTQVYLRVGQSRRSAARQFPALAAGLGYAPPSVDAFDRKTDIDADLHIDTQDGGVSLAVDWDVADVVLTSVSAWRYWDWDVANDRDFTGIPIQRVQRIPSRQDQYSQELRVASRDEGPLQYVGGLYFFNQRITGTPKSIYGPEAAYWLLNQANFTVPIPRNLLDGYAQLGDAEFEMHSYAAFTEVNYAVLPRVTATLGARYTYEDKNGRYATRVSGGLDLAGLPTATANELNRAKLSIFRPQAYDVSDSDGSLSGRANLAWQVTDDLFAYAGYAYGFKSGGINMSGLPLDAQNRPTLGTAVIEDERNRTFELGVKATLLDGRATVNLAAYHTTVKDYQANIVSSVETAAIRSYPSNIPEVRVRGVELDVAAEPLPALMLRASVAYAEGENTDYPAGPCPLEVQTAVTVACDLTGERLAGLSRWVGSIAVDHVLPMGDGQWLLHADWNARSDYNSDTSVSRFTRLAGYGVLNANVGYRFSGGWELLVFGRNVLDKDYITALTIQTGNSGLILGQPGDPRTLGLTLRAAL